MTYLLEFDQIGFLATGRVNCEIMKKLQIQKERGEHGG